MGKRKKSLKKVVKKTVEKLSVVFNCPRCSYPKCCKCTINKKESRATIACSVCKAKFIAETGVLTEPVDIYAKWIDSLEAVNPLPYADPEEGDDEQKESDHDSDGY